MTKPLYLRGCYIILYFPICVNGFWSGRRDLNPRPSRWQRDVLPLNYTRNLSAEEWNRTIDLLFFRETLLPLSYLGKYIHFTIEIASHQSISGH